MRLGNLLWSGKVASADSANRGRVRCDNARNTGAYQPGTDDGIFIVIRPTRVPPQVHLGV